MQPVRQLGRAIPAHVVGYGSPKHGLTDRPLQQQKGAET
jgi:hypothetical protein